MEEMKKEIFHRLEQAHRQFHSLEVLVIVEAAVHPTIAAGIALGDFAGHVAWAAIHPQPHEHANKAEEKTEQNQTEQMQSVEQRPVEPQEQQVREHQLNQTMQ